VFVGYPKTGSTWVRFMVGRYVQLISGGEKLPLFDHVDKHGDGESAGAGPPMYFTHEPLRWESQTAADLNEDNTVGIFAGKRVVLLVRHPLDALVSSWHQATRKVGTFDGDLEAFVADPVYGLDKFLRFYGLWAPGVSAGSVHLLRYEDLRADPAGGLRGLLDFLDLAPEPDAIAQAVEFGSFDSMKRMEAEDKAPVYESSGLGVFATGDRSDPDAFHVRRGVVGGYREYLSAESSEHQLDLIRARMDPVYGYER
jgi:hypothetical protein